MKKLLLVFILIGIFLLTKPVEAISKLHVDGRYIKNETGDIVILRGVNYGGYNGMIASWPEEGSDENTIRDPWDDERPRPHYRVLRDDWGANAMRWHMTAEAWINDTNDYRYKLRRGLQIANEEGFYVILDVCRASGADWDKGVMPFQPYDKHSVFPDNQSFIDYWVNLSIELNDLPNWMIDPYNEPHRNRSVTYYEDRAVWFDVVARLIHAVRNVTDRIVLVQWMQGVWYGGMEEQPRVWVDDFISYLENDSANTNIVISTHQYHDHFTYWGWGGPRPNTFEQLRTEYTKCGLTDAATEINYPLIIGEIGADNERLIGQEWEEEKIWFRNTLTLHNEWGVSHLAWIWTREGQYPSYSLLERSTWIPPPNEAGQILIDTFRPPISGRLKDIDNNPVQADITAYQQDTDNIANKNQTNSTGDYKLRVRPGTYDLQFDISSFPNFFIKLSSLNIFSKLEDVINNIDYDSNIVSFSADLNDIQLIQTYSSETPTKILINGTAIPNVSSYSGLKNNTWFYDESENKLYLLANPTVPTVYCGNGVCQPTEDCSSCPSDCGVCPPVCGDGACESGETQVNCCSDCGCPLGFICNTTTNECHTPTGNILFEDSFESGYNPWTITGTTGNGSITINQTFVYDGVNASRHGSSYGLGKAYARKDITGQEVIYIRTYVLFENVSAIPDWNIIPFMTIFKGGTFVAEVSLRYMSGTDYSWKLGRNIPASEGIESSDFTPQSETWYCVELEFVRDAINGKYRVWVDGEEKIADTGLDTTGVTDIDRVYAGAMWTPIRDAVYYILDSFVVSDNRIGC